MRKPEHRTVDIIMFRNNTHKAEASPFIWTVLRTINETSAIKLQHFEM